jgi:hypothetical protein
MLARLAHYIPQIARIGAGGMQRGILDDMIVSLHEHFRLRAVDWLLSAILVSWGFALFAINPAIWALPTFSGLSAIASQSTWAAVATLIGIARLCALFVNGAVQRSPHARLIGAALAIFIWVQLSLGMFYSALVGPGIAIFPWLAFADVFNVWRAAMDAHASDYRASERRRTVARRAPST